ncbi:Pachytene checkpoint protein 2-like protein [Armadillidium vulgare]|nr:Pachytene checkpoint protein 2-like protein [Armadillidium vulgare]
MQAITSSPIQVNVSHTRDFQSNYESSKPLLHVEVLQAHKSQLKKEDLTEKVDEFLKTEKTLATDEIFKSSDLPSLFKGHVEQIQLCGLRSSTEPRIIDVDDVSRSYHVYKLDVGGPGVEELGGGGDDDVPAATHWLLPSAEFQHLWDSLIFDTDIKDQLASFVSSTMLFSDCGVNCNIISWNRVLLLHGPPGTGKTSLCKALAQKVSIRMNHRYKYGQLFEVNSHSLFSKWFSESGKLVQKLFTKITELLEDPDSLVFVLIDEVESLTRMRSATANGAEPSDAMRVVNALLTQLDHIKRYPNVLILTTSNVTGTIDLAFVDRADIKQYIGLPSQGAIYQIYLSCLNELMNTKIISSKQQLLTIRQLQITNMEDRDFSQSVGLSGRSLRKIPFLAHALHAKRDRPSLTEFLQAMVAAVHKHQADASQL